jgi:predicted MFS family arabinose efflux permease
MKYVLLLAIGMFALGFDAYIIAGLIPEITATFATSDANVGQAVSIFTICYAISAPLFASMLAGKSINKALLVSITLFGIANAVSALAPTFTIFLLSRAVAGIGAGIFSPLAIAGATQLVPAHMKGRALSFTIGGMSMGTVIGVPIGMYVANFFSWQFVMWAITAISILAAISINLLLPHIPVMAPPSIKERLALFVDKRVTLTVSITLFASISSLGLYTYISPLLGQLASINDITVFLWSWGIGGLVGSLSIGYIIDYYKKPKVIAFGILFILTISIICIPLLIDVPFVKYIPFFVWGAMGWAAQAPQQHILLSYQPTQGGAAVALNSSINYLGSALGATLGGLLLSFHIGSMYLIHFAVVCMVLSIVLQVYSLIRTTRVEKTRKN